MGYFQDGEDAITVRKDVTSCTFKTCVREVWKVADITYTTSPGTGVHGITYADVTGTLSFRAGESEKTFTVNILNNELAESKNFTLEFQILPTITLLVH